jgi:hypothetical protein
MALRPLTGHARTLTAVAVAVAAGALVAGAYVAPAVGRDRTPQVSGSTDVAGRSPFAGRHCNVATDYYTSPGGKEGEPYIAVNPAHPRNRVVAYMDAARATVDVAYTRSAGRRWRHSVPRGVDGCTGNHSNRWEASGDPWVSIGPDGTAYLSALTWAHFVTPPTKDYVSLLHIQTSHTGGRTWSKPVYIAGHHAVSDKPMVLANPYRAGVAYVIWRNQGFGLATGKRARTRLLFSSTHTAGREWTRPRVIAAGSPSDFFENPQVSILRSGTLVATSSLADPGGGNNLLSWRSTDGGRHWRGPQTVQHIPDGANPAFCGQAAAGGDGAGALGQQTAIRGRSVAFVFLNGKAASAGRGRLVMARSRDGGRSWRTHTVVRSRDPLLLATITANRHGRVGVLYDRVDTSRINCGANKIPTQTRFTASSDGGSTWTRAAVVGPPWWNLATSARGTGGFSGYFVGDYQAVAPAPGGFASVSVQGPALTRPHRPAISGATGVIVGDVRVTRRRH